MNQAERMTAPAARALSMNGIITLTGSGSRTGGTRYIARTPAPSKTGRADAGSYQSKGHTRHWAALRVATGREHRSGQRA